MTGRCFLVHFCSNQPKKPLLNGLYFSLLQLSCNFRRIFCRHIHQNRAEIPPPPTRQIWQCCRSLPSCKNVLSSKKS